MANTTFGNLKINALRRSGNRYNANDATLLSIAGNIINDALSIIGQQIKGHPYTLDLNNTVSTVASQAYVALADTDIIEILQFKQATTNTKLKQVTYEEYVSMFPNTALVGGVPELCWAPTQSVNGSGQNIWTVYLGWTPSSIITMTYDYIKNMRFSADTGVDTAYSPLPSVYDRWIYAEFSPLFYEFLNPNDSRIGKAESKAAQVRAECLNDLKNAYTHQIQMGRFGEDVPVVWKPVATTTQP